MSHSTRFTPVWLRRLRIDSFLRTIIDDREIAVCECCNRPFESHSGNDLCSDCRDEDYLNELACS